MDEFSICVYRECPLSPGSTVVSINLMYRLFCIYDYVVYLVTGQERFRSTLSTSYYKGAHAVILVYSTTDRESFRNVQEFWLNQVHIQYGNDATDKLPVLLVGTKSDLLKKYDEQQEHVKKVDSRCMKGTTDRLLGPIHCSAKTGRNVDRVFQKIADIECSKR